MGERRASVVIPTRAGARRLPVLLTALAAQSVRAEVVVVVDGDVDGSADVVTGWADRLDLRVVVLPENRGRSAALNAGFEAATGEVLLRCDDDLDPGPEHVARHLSHHDDRADTDPPAGVVGLCRNVFPDTAYAAAYGRPRDAAFARTAYGMVPDQRWRLWGANVSVTRATWEKVGRYDEAFRAYGWEDVDWGYRLHRLGAEVVLDPALEARHLGAPTTTVARAERAYLSGAARRAFEAKHPDAALPPPLGATAWDRLVGGAARTLGPRGLAVAARLADRAAGSLPDYLAEKSVALVVEGAAAAGHRRGAGSSWAGRTDAV